MENAVTCPDGLGERPLLASGANERLLADAIQVVLPRAYHAVHVLDLSALLLFAKDHVTFRAKLISLAGSEIKISQMTSWLMHNDFINDI